MIHPQPDPLIHRAIVPWQNTSGSGERPRYTGWGGARADSTPFGEALRIAGREFASGLGVLAGSRLELRGSGFARLTAEVGIDESAPVDGQRARFEIYGDGALLAQSEWLAQGMAAQPLAAELGGAEIVELVVRPESEGGLPLPVTWGNAALLHEAADATP